jgi:hypothetical protein
MAMKRHGMAALACLALVAPALAGTATGEFAVTVNLWPRHQAPSLCITEALKTGSGGTVRVACQSNQFVNIEVTPGKSFGATHGTASRGGLAVTALDALKADMESRVGPVTVTALRIFNDGGDDGPLQMLVSF